mmetsp:Transcript_25386/g.83478  ORF Transcript_25386/g.83478 Transcript_25386/m.83478 type:complete len:108 (-) Transcript_25386:968-1291(-)
MTVAAERSMSAAAVGERACAGTSTSQASTQVTATHRALAIGRAVGGRALRRRRELEEQPRRSISPADPSAAVAAPAADAKPERPDAPAAPLPAAAAVAAAELPARVR